jgi:ABC-2 type transport system permease protein
VARQFALLKLRLVRNGLRSPQYAVLFTIGSAGAAVVSFAGFVFLATLRTDAIRWDATLVAFAAVTVVWTVLPLMGFGTDETLDPQRLALLPLRRGQLLRGLLVAALIGIAPIATAFALAGAIVGLARDFLTASLILGAIAGTLVLCVVASRTLIALLAPLLRSRRGRDLLVMTIVLAAFVPQSFRLFGARGGTENTRHAIAEIANRVQYTPFGWGGLAASEAGQGNVLASLGALAAIAALVVVLLWVWSLAIPRAMTATDLAAAEVARGRRAGRTTTLFPGLLPFLPRTRAGAVAAKELRYYVRDPRRRAPVFAALIVPGLFLFSMLREAQNRPGSSTMLALVALLPASGLTLNQFGLDGAALWSTIVAGNDPRSELVGKNLATAIIVVPLVAVPALLAAAITNGWHYVPITVGLAPGMLGVVLAVGNMVSVWVPYALPDRRNPLAGNPGQGCVGGLAAMTALLVDAIILVPVGVVTAIALHSLPLAAATIVSVGCATVYGALAWRVGMRSASRYLWWRMPELLDAVSPRHAG